MNNYKLIKVNSIKEWDSFILTTNTSNIFNYSEYFIELDSNIALYFVMNNNEKRAGLILIENEKRNEIIENDFFIYSGIIFGHPTTGQNISQITSEHYRLTEYVAIEIPKIYKKLNIVMSPSIIDIRPFQWYNYGEINNRYLIDIKYTSYLNINSINDTEELNKNTVFKNLSSARRQEIRYGKREGVYTKEELHLEEFIYLYKKTMSVQGVRVENSKLKEMRNIILAMHTKKIGKMFTTYNQNNDIGSIVFFIFYKRRAYYLFGVNDPNVRNHHTGSVVLWDTFKILSNDGIEEIDFEGVNSPKRGWFKLSYGSSLIPYYRISYG